MLKYKTKLLVILLSVLLYGCSGAYPVFERNNKEAFRACIDSGGVPLQAWFNEKVLGDCVYKPIAL